MYINHTSVQLFYMFPFKKIFSVFSILSALNMTPKFISSVYTSLNFRHRYPTASLIFVLGCLMSSLLNLACPTPAPPTIIFILENNNSIFPFVQVKSLRPFFTYFFLSAAQVQSIANLLALPSEQNLYLTMWSIMYSPTILTSFLVMLLPVGGFFIFALLNSRAVLWLALANVSFHNCQWFRWKLSWQPGSWSKNDMNQSHRHSMKHMYFNKK